MPGCSIPEYCYSLKSQTIQKLPVMSPPMETEGGLAQWCRCRELALELDAISLSVATCGIRQPQGEVSSCVQSTVGTRLSPGEGEGETGQGR